jgi:hypothetical protein
MSMGGAKQIFLWPNMISARWEFRRADRWRDDLLCALKSIGESIVA